MLRMLLVDAHSLLREMLASHLSAHAQVASVLQAADADEAVEVVRQANPDIVLTDIEMPGRDVFDAVEAMRITNPQSKVIFLTGRDCDVYIERALQVQAHGYMLKGDGVEVVIQAIERVSAGDMFFSESIQRRMGVQNGRLCLMFPRSAAVAVLTSRERELLTHLALGASLKEAAAEMRVSYKTADNQKASLMRKLDIHDRVELARFAIREGLAAPV